MMRGIVDALKARGFTEGQIEKILEAIKNTSDIDEWLEL